MLISLYFILDFFPNKKNIFTKLYSSLGSLNFCFITIVIKDESQNIPNLHLDLFSKCSVHKVRLPAITSILKQQAYVIYYVTYALRGFFLNRNRH